MLNSTEINQEIHMKLMLLIVIIISPNKNILITMNINYRSIEIVMQIILIQIKILILIPIPTTVNRILILIYNIKIIKMAINLLINILLFPMKLITPTNIICTIISTQFKIILIPITLAIKTLIQ